MSESYTDQVELRPGMGVESRDGEKLGKIVRLESDQLLVEKGFFFPHDYWVPSSAVENADDDTVYLSMDKDQVLSQDWSAGTGAWDADAQRAAAGYGIDRPGTTTGAMAYNNLENTSGTDVSATRSYETPLIDESATTGATPDLTTDRTGNLNAAGRTNDMSTTGSATGDSMTVPVYEEELTATTRPVEAGNVSIDKDVVTEERTLNVPVTEERVRVTRRAVDRDATAAGDAFTGGTIDVPVTTEAVDVQKRTRVAEEIDVAKEAVSKTKTVADKVRREVVDVKDNTGTAMSGDSTDLTSGGTTR